jgi:hypothetical protein
MAVTGTTNENVTVATGFCAIADSSSPSASSPGLYLCAIDSSSEVLPALASTSGGATRTDLIYASVSETSFTVITKTSDGTDATLTTSAAHGFKVGQTVVISGVDDFFDGSHVLKAGTTDSTIVYARSGTYTAPANNGLGTTVSAYVEGWSDTPDPNGLYQVKITNKLVEGNLVTLTTSANHGFPEGSLVKVVGVSSELDGTYEAATGTATNSVVYIKTASPVGSTAVTTSAVARARVPFAIKIEEGIGGDTVPSLPAGTNLELASVKIEGTSAIVSDRRKFTTGLNGVHVHNGSVGSATPSAVDGRLRYNTATKSLSVYDSVAESWRVIVDGATGHHDDEAEDASATALHHTLGTGQFNAAKGNHVHAITTTRLGLNTGADATANIISSNKEVTSKTSSNPTVLSQTSALNIPAGSSVFVIATASVTVTAAGTKCNFGIKEKDGTIIRSSVLGDVDGQFSITATRYYSNVTDSGAIYQLAAYLDSDAGDNDEYIVFDADLIVIPFSSITTNTLT